MAHLPKAPEFFSGTAPLQETGASADDAFLGTLTGPIPEAQRRELLAQAEARLPVLQAEIEFWRLILLRLGQSPDVTEGREGPPPAP